MRTLAAFLALALLAGCDDPVPPAPAEITIKIPEQASEEDRTVIARAVKAFLTACPAIADGFGKRYTLLKADLPAEPFDYQAEGWGWTRMVYVEVKRDDGHVLHFVLGGGRDNGVLSRKSISAEACGWAGNTDGSDTFHPLAEMKFLDDGRYENPLTAVPTGPAVDWKPAAGNIWPGVRLYFGDWRVPTGTVVDFDENHVTDSGRKIRAVLVRMESGALEWKDRESIVSGPWFVRADDPAMR
jgi:hypothetical protein